MADVACPKGRFWETDANGFIRNDARLDRIAANYRPAIERMVAAYRFRHGAALHCVYLRGSVPRGLAVPGFSDLDSLALVTGEGEAVSPDWAALEEERTLAVCPELTGVQFETYALEDAVQRDRVSELGFVLKTQAVCVHGDDVSAALPGYRPDRTVANIDLVRIGTDIEEALDEIRRRPADGARTAYWCRRIMKNLIRACFALTLSQERRYTRDLGLCAARFLAHFPEQKPDMEQALRFALYPTEEVDELIEFLAGFGCWVNARANDWLDVHNPRRCLEMARSEPDRRQD